MVKKKGASKRLTLHKKYKILRKVREHKRKVRKGDGKKGRKNKDPGIPNAWPFKEELLNEIEQARLAEIERVKQLKDDKKKQKQMLLEKERLQMNALSTMPELMPESVEAKSQNELKRAVETSDLILFVLDARDPQGSRSLTFEDGALVKGNKKLVLILNKIDLIPVALARKWVNYLKRFHPIIPVKALSKDYMPTKNERRLHEQVQQMDGSVRDNGDVTALQSFLTQYTAKMNNNDKSKLNIAVVGYPNVGKSTIFNSIKRKFLSPNAPTAFTTKVVISTQFKTHNVLDCPPLDPSMSDASAHLLRQCISGSTYDVDPVPAIEHIFQRGDMMQLISHFRISACQNIDAFLAKIATKRGYLRKGGEPNILMVARVILKSMENKTLPFVSLPPSSKKKAYEMPTWWKEMDSEELQECVEKFWKKCELNDTMQGKEPLEFVSSTVSNVNAETFEYDHAIAGSAGQHLFRTNDDDDDDDDDHSSSEEEESDEDVEMEDNENDSSEEEESEDNDEEAPDLVRN